MAILDKVKENPIATITTVLSAGTAIVTAIYGIENHYATKKEVKHDMKKLAVDVIDVAIMKYEDDLMTVDFKIQTGKGDDYDKILKQQIERRLVDLKAKKLKKED